MSVQSSPQPTAPPPADSLVNGYEFMFILDPTLDDAASLAVVERVEGIVKGQGGEIVSLKPWERRRLAYPIAGHNEGLYILCYFDAPPASIRDIESRVRLTEGVLRFIVLRTDKETRERDQAADLRRARNEPPALPLPPLRLPPGQVRKRLGSRRKKSPRNP